MIHHIVVYLNYGSIVTNEQDLNNLNTLSRSFINNEMFTLVADARDPAPFDLTGKELEEFSDRREFYDIEKMVERDLLKQAAGFTSGYTIPARLVDKSQLHDWVKGSIPDDDHIDIFGLADSS